MKPKVHPSPVFMLSPPIDGWHQQQQARPSDAAEDSGLPHRHHVQSFHERPESIVEYAQRVPFLAQQVVEAQVHVETGSFGDESP